MIKVFFKIVIALLFVSIHLEAQSLEKGFIHRNNQDILDSQNKKIILNGVNLGGWLIWEGWIWGGGLHSESKMMKNITKCTDSLIAESFRESVRASFITREDIKAIARLKFNCIRIPINHHLLDKGTYESTFQDEAFKQIDSVLKWCKEFKVYAILDLHALPGGQNNLFISDPDKISLWESEKNKDQSKLIWFELAKRYSKRTIIAGYDLINEPSINNCNELVSFYKDLIDTIRSVDKNHMIIIEGNKFAHSFQCFDQLLDSNQIFSFHFYPWFRSNKGKFKKLNRYAEFAKEINSPLWVGEWGEDKLHNLKYIYQLLNHSSFNFSGSAFWTWKKTEASNNLAINRINVSNNFKRIIKGKKINNREHPKKVLYDFLENCKISNTGQSQKMIELFKP